MQPVPAVADPAGLMKNGKVEIRLSLADVNDQVLARLKQLGLEVVFHPKGMKLLIGRIAVARLESLAQIPSVTYIALAR